MNKWMIWVASGLVATGFATSALAEGAQEEISTAHAHALLAQSATTLDMAHTHLHHVINCLVGPEGAGFDAAAGNPCDGQGNGAIPDSGSDAALQGKLQAALSSAQEGLKSQQLEAVQSEAGKLAAALQDTPSQKASGGYSW